MNFVYYYQKKKDLDKPKSKHFFEMIKDNKWQFLELYKPLIKSLERWRTAEVHHGCILKGLFIRGHVADHHEIHEIINVIFNAFWPNLLLIMQGKNPTASYFSTPGYR